MSGPPGLTNNPHLTTELAWSGAPLADARLVAILLHGREQSPALVRDLVGDALGPDLALVAPAAAGGSWYPASFLAPRATNEPRLGQALARVESLARALRARGIGPARQLVIGFSQGACLACEYAWTATAPLAGVIGFTGGLIGPPGTAWRPRRELAGTAVWLSGSEADPWVPAARVRETAEAFAASGASVELELYPGTDHAIRAAELAGARAVVAGIAART